MKVSVTLPLEIQVGDKKVVIDENVHAVLREYVKTGMGIDELAERLGLDNWSEAYEVLKQVPAWLLWLPPSVLKSSISQESQQAKIEEKKEEKAEKKKRSTRKRAQKPEAESTQASAEASSSDKNIKKENQKEQAPEGQTAPSS